MKYFLLILSCSLINLSFGEVKISLDDQVEVQSIYEQEMVTREQEFQNTNVSEIKTSTQGEALELTDSDGLSEEELTWQEKTFYKFGVGVLLGSFSNPTEKSSTSAGFRLDMMSTYSALGVDFKTWDYIPEENKHTKQEIRFYEIKPWIHYYRASYAPVHYFVPYLGVAPSFNTVKAIENGESVSYNRFGLHGMVGIRSTINEFVRLFGEAEYAYIKDVNGFNASLGALYLF